MRALFLATALLFSIAARAQQAYQPRVGDRLTYHVETTGGTEYDFIVTISQLAESTAFNYEMTGDATRTGSVMMTPEAMSKATALYNYFSGGPVTLTNQTSVFVSTTFASAAAEEGLDVALAEGDEPIRFDNIHTRDSERSGSYYMALEKSVGKEKYSFDGPILENADGSLAIRLTEGAHPFITFMKERAFKIYLTSVSRDKK